RQQDSEIKGTMVYVSSPMARFSFPWSGGYAASKAATDAFVRGLRREWSNTGIRFVTAYPGATATEVGKNEVSPDRLPPWHEGGSKMKVDECARRLLKAAAAGQSEAVLASSIQVLMTSQRFIPALAERIINRVGATPQ